MKGLAVIPTLKDLEQAYQELQSQPLHIDAAKLSLWSQWSRFDPRLGEQWISYIENHWEQLLPMEFNQALRTQPWPAAAGPLLLQAYTSQKNNNENVHAFRIWSRCAMTGIKQADNELFFIGTRVFAGKLVQQDVEKALTPYTKWGYFSQDLLRNKVLANDNSTLMPQAARSVFLSALLAGKTSIKVAEYIAAANGAISRREAQLDLAKRSDLKKVGQTKGAYYVVRKTSKK